MRTRVAAWVCGAVLAVLATLVSTASAQAQQPEPAPAAPPECPSLQGCYGYADMQAFYDEIIGWVGDFSKVTFADMPAPDFVYVKAGTTVGSGCGVLFDPYAYAYCTLDDTVYVGQDQLWEFYSGVGDAAAALGIAHEWGHHVQHVTGIEPTDRHGIIAKENQADCIAGAWVGYVDSRGRLERDDMRDINRVLELVSSAESGTRDHGTLKERTAAVELGFGKGISGCDSYFPDQPITSRSRKDAAVSAA